LADKNADRKREAPLSSEYRFVDLLLYLSATLSAWKTQADDCADKLADRQQVAS